jgi:tetratricopeptide (TPR) repeat protein
MAQAKYDEVGSLPGRDADLGPRRAYIGACDAARQVLNRYGPNFDRLMLMGHCDMRVGAYARARACFAAALTYRPDSRAAKDAVGKADDYRSAAKLIARGEHDGKYVLEVRKMVSARGSLWIGLLAGDWDDLGYGRNYEVVIASLSRSRNSSNTLLTVETNDLGLDYWLDTIRPTPDTGPQVLMYGHRHLGDGTPVGELLVLAQRSKKWMTALHLQCSHGWVDRSSKDLAIFAENPIYWRSGIDWADVYRFRKGQWREVDSEHPAFYADAAEEYRRDVREQLADSTTPHDLWLTWEALGRASALCGRKSQAVRAFRKARLLCFQDMSIATFADHGEESDFSRIGRELRAAKRSTLIHVDR